jgi:hypothetical protein
VRRSNCGDFEHRSFLTVHRIAAWYKKGVDAQELACFGSVPWTSWAPFDERTPFHSLLNTSKHLPSETESRCPKTRQKARVLSWQNSLANRKHLHIDCQLCPIQFGISRRSFFKSHARRTVVVDRHFDVGAPGATTGGRLSSPDRKSLLIQAIVSLLSCAPAAL